jgi:hypothetical protein
MKLLIKMKVVLLLLLITLFSCKKDIVTDAKSVVDNISDYYALRDLTNNNGTISFNSSKSFASDAQAVYQISCVLFDKNRNLIKQGDLSINDWAIKPTSQGFILTDIKMNTQVGSLYGKALSIQASKDNSGLTARGDDVILNTNFRLPSEVVVTSPNPTSGSQILNVNEVIKWIPDPENKKKMLIAIEFDPTTYINKDFKNEKAVANYAEVDDNGMYQLKSSDFKNIPKNSAVSIYVTRGNYAKVPSTSSNEQYAIVGYSLAQNQFKTQ